MTTSKAVAIRVTQLLKEKEMTRYRLEKNMAISRNTMRAIFRNENDGINLKTVFLLIKGLDMTPAEFFDDPIFKYENIEFN